MSKKYRSRVVAGLVPSVATSVSATGRTDKWKRRCFLLVWVWLSVTLLMSIPSVRGIVSYPLYVHDEDARGDIAYVMADGHASWERLRIASDLYHRKRVPRILLLEENQPAGFNFKRGELDTRTQRAIDYLALHGVPRDCISLIQADASTALGSLSEARGLARQETGIKRLVVVTSAPHTRRSRLCFQRAFPGGVSVQVYSASAPADSAEINSPIWLEYAKLVAYFFIA